jgi:hypothetical protein
VLLLPTEKIEPSGPAAVLEVKGRTVLTYRSKLP